MQLANAKKKNNKLHYPTHVNVVELTNQKFEKAYNREMRQRHSETYR